jgi:hypothetical protein
MSSVEKQDWLEYLILTLETEPVIKRFAPFFKLIIEEIKSGTISFEKGIGYLEAVVPSVLQECTNKSRTEQLMKGILSFTKKKHLTITKE